MVALLLKLTLEPLRLEVTKTVNRTYYVLIELAGEKAYLLKNAVYMVYDAMHRRDNYESENYA